jgi:hypothetical protein
LGPFICMPYVILSCLKIDQKGYPGTVPGMVPGTVVPGTVPG